MNKLSFTKKLSAKQLALFSKSLHDFLNAGLLISNALIIISENQRNKAFKRQLMEIANHINQGNKISKSFAQSHSFFPTLYIEMIKMGETSGKLTEVLEHLYHYYSEQSKIKNKVLQSISYPCIIFIVTCFVMIFLFTQVVPVFIETLVGMGGEIPPITQLILSIYTFFQQFGFGIFIFIVLAIICTKYLKKIPNFSLVLDRFKLRLPVIGRLLFLVDAIRFTKSIKMLMDAGISLQSSLDVVQCVLKNSYFTSKIKAFKINLRNGFGITQSLSCLDFFPNDFLSIIKTGESLGELDNAFYSLSNLYEQELEHRLSILSRLIEPTIIILAGLIIATIVISVMLPLYQMYEGYINIL